MPKTYDTQAIVSALGSTKNALILLSQNPSTDSVAASLSLYLALSKKPLNTTIGCVTPMTVNFNRLFGVDKISPRIGNQNLIISFSYPEDSLEKVSYDKDPQNQKLHLTIKPKSGHQPLDSSQVSYSYTGSTADIVFVVSAPTLDSLGEIYFKEKALLDDPKKAIVNLSNQTPTPSFGSINLIDPNSASVSEIVYTLIKDLNLAIDSDIATNLLAGIKQATNDFSSPNTTATTFQIVSDLMKQGAKKNHLLTSLGFQPRPTPPIPTPPINLPPPPPPTPSTTFSASPAPIPPSLSTQNANLLADPFQPAPAQPDPAPSPDWLKPKVFNSSTNTPSI